MGRQPQGWADLWFLLVLAWCLQNAGLTRLSTGPFVEQTHTFPQSYEVYKPERINDVRLFSSACGDLLLYRRETPRTHVSLWLSA